MARLDRVPGPGMPKRPIKKIRTKPRVVRVPGVPKTPAQRVQIRRVRAGSPEVQHIYPTPFRVHAKIQGKERTAALTYSGRVLTEKGPKLPKQTAGLLFKTQA